MPKKAQAAKKAAPQRKAASRARRAERELGKPLNAHATPVTKRGTITLAQAEKAVRAYLARSH